MTDRRRKPDPDDLALWKKVAGETQPIRRRNERTAPAKPAAKREPEPAPPKPAAAPRKAAAPQAATKPKPAQPSARRPEPKPLERGEIAGVDKRQAGRLKRGRLPIEARIDLHGLTLENAHRRLVSFLNRAQEEEKRAVLVVTGKGLREGSGVIRAQMPHWLNEPRLRPLILAYEYAQPRDGGMGALYILLRRKR